MKFLYMDSLPIVRLALFCKEAVECLQHPKERRYWYVFMDWSNVFFVFLFWWFVSLVMMNRTMK